MTEISTQNLPEYQHFLAQATAQIRQARTKAAQAVNREAISLYWWLGEQIVKHQGQYNWGKSVVERLAQDLKTAFPDAKFGFSPQNLWYMRQFYLEYKDRPNLQQLVGEIPWGLFSQYRVHNLLVECSSLAACRRLNVVSVRHQI